MEGEFEIFVNKNCRYRLFELSLIFGGQPGGRTCPRKQVEYSLLLPHEFALSGASFFSPPSKARSEEKMSDFELNLFNQNDDENQKNCKGGNDDSGCGLL